MAHRILAIESATDWLSVALATGDEIHVCLEAEGTRQHASSLMPLVERAFEQTRWTLDEIDGLAISTGPGSFTSLRIGLATAKGLAFGRSWDGIGISTLEAMAAGGFDAVSKEEVSSEAPEGVTQSSRPDREVLVLLDARRGEWYAGSWCSAASPEGPRLVPGLTEGLYSPEQLAADLDRPVVVCAPDLGDSRSKFEAAGLAIESLVEGPAARPRADWVAKLGAFRLTGDEGGPVNALAARYLRRAEAEAKRLGGPVEIGELARVDDRKR